MSGASKVVAVSVVSLRPSKVKQICAVSFRTEKAVNQAVELNERRKQIWGLTKYRATYAI